MYIILRKKVNWGVKYFILNWIELNWFKKMKDIEKRYNFKVIIINVFYVWLVMLILDVVVVNFK